MMNCIFFSNHGRGSYGIGSLVYLWMLFFEFAIEYYIGCKINALMCRGGREDELS